MRGIAYVIILFFSVYVGAAPFNHSTWDKVLKEHVILINNGNASQVDYDKLRKNSSELKSYLDSVSRVSQSDFNTWPESERLAFLINTYNAFTIDLILTKYPDINSIKDLGGFFSSPWKKKFIPLFGKTAYLDFIEHEIIRKEFKESRVHFAVNCASIGCPMLAPEAFQASTIDAQLEKGLKAFLSDATRNTYDKKSGFLEVSKIFDWYKEDFEKGYQGFRSINDVMAKYAELLTDDKNAQTEIKNKKVKIKFLEYDWKLNKK